MAAVSVLSVQRYRVECETPANSQGGRPGGLAHRRSWNAQDQAMTLRYQEIDRAARILGVSVVSRARLPDRGTLLLTVMPACVLRRRATSLQQT